ncbi:Mur ligase family protein [Vagococcus intermedius]|uniref:Mur ligase family protein n=1 Tax=Vagococcus intermedius TaxID=2991418 RepID=A0AAF0I650_9ENTE|nr:Mur ligase family protein [Vagococcus intermedius]WEG72480.1 Mur ligase family protein [Vagococcus intermedius]WEG74567.1 Mur ligase family protein [Vagococcus intermedius]
MKVKLIEQLLEGYWYIEPKGNEIINQTIIDATKLASLKNSLFIAMDHETWLKGSGNKKGSIYDSWTDSHELVLNYRENVSLLIVQKPIEELKEIPQFVMKNTYEALTIISEQCRKEFEGKIIAITGTVGKSSTQNFILKLLRSKYKVMGYGNSRTAVRTGLAKLSSDYQFGVLEVAMAALWYGKTGIAKEIKPDIALITQIGIGQRGTSEEKTASYKARIASGLTENGVVIINQDIEVIDCLLKEVSQYTTNIMTYGLHGGDIVLEKSEKTDDTYTLTVKNNLANTKYCFSVPYLDDGFISNVLATISTLYALNEDVNSYLSLFNQFKLPKHVLEKQFLPNNSLLIDDTYNAEQLSMKNAISYSKKELSNFKGNKIAILGRIINLREYSEEVHRSLAPLLIDAGFDSVYTYGPEIDCLQDELPPKMRGGHFTNQELLLSYVVDNCQENSYILLKGSSRNSDIKKIRPNLVTKLSDSKKKISIIKKETDSLTPQECLKHNQLGMGNILIVLKTLELINLNKIKLSDVTICSENPPKSGKSKRSVGLVQGSSYSILELLKYSANLNAPDALICLAESIWGSRSQAKNGLKKMALEKGLGQITVKNITGRKCKEEQQTRLVDLQIIASEFKKLPLANISLLQNNPIIINDKEYSVQSPIDQINYTLSSIVWGETLRTGLLFRIIQGKLEVIIVFNNQNYMDMIREIDKEMYNNTNRLLLANMT